MMHGVTRPTSQIPFSFGTPAGVQIALPGTDDFAAMMGHYTVNVIQMEVPRPLVIQPSVVRRGFLKRFSGLRS